MALTLPYKAEYAKSGRAGCKMCKTSIEKGTLRLAVMVQSRFHDGKDAHWFHSTCFFQKHRPSSVGDIEDFESLRYEDQETVKKKIGEGGGGASGSSGSGKGKGKTQSSAKDFRVEYAKSAKSGCVACEDFIGKGLVRLSKKDFTSERALMFAAGSGLDRWHHLDCFVKVREEIEFFDAASEKSLAGFKDLDRDDQQMLKKKLPAIKPKRKLEDASSSSEAPKKKAKTEGKDQQSEEDLIRKQNKRMYSNRDSLENGLKKQELIQVLNSNNQLVPDGPKSVLDLVADIMTFGAMKRCTDCVDGQFMYKSGVGYQCTGYISEFTKCGYVVDGDVDRKPFKVPNDLREYPVFASYKYKAESRVIPKHAAPVKGHMPPTQKEGPKLKKNPLKGFKLLLSGLKKTDQSLAEEKIKQFGGEITKRCSAGIAAVISTQDEVKKDTKEIQRAKKYGIPVVSMDLVTNLRELNYKLADEMKKHLLCDWVEDIHGRLKTLNEEFEKPKVQRREIFETTTSSSMKLKMKDGAVIDPQSGLDDGPYHVYKTGNLYYNCVLNHTSIEDGLNSFYKIQIIESDRSPKCYHVFRAWGRIGTTIGGHQTDEQPSQEDAVELFRQKYQEKTGNVWGSKFVKKPGKYTSLDIDYGQKDLPQKLVPSTENSRLAIAVQSLISLIFDVDIMKRTLLEFELDTEKMPLGKISRKQILEAYSVLTDSLKFRGNEKDERKLQRLMQDVSNRFYTLIPHNFGTRIPPLLDNDELLKTKIEMLDNLMEIEIAYELLVQGDNGENSAIDSHYKSLNAEIDVVEAHSEEFKIINKYLHNTHAPTHSSYTLEIDQVFKVIRKGENKRYRPFKDLHNRRLLWHGSRVTNFAGIISQGLRIAPPEAPATGYMFGKGIYFADMVSKSANYCFTSRDNPTGLLLLCEVALGDMHELKQAKDVIKPPNNKHSVKGLGETEPDPAETHTFSDGVLVPYGKPVKSKSKNMDLLYNEYIVYDVAQVNVKYMLRVNFNHGGGRR